MTTCNARARSRMAAVLLAGAVMAGACTSDQPGAPLFREGPFTITGLPGDSVLLLGSTTQLHAVAPDGADDVKEVDVAWSTSDREVATITDGGLLRGVGLGTADVIATSDEGVVAHAISVRFGIRLPGRDDDDEDAVTTSLLGGAVRIRVPPGAVAEDAVLHMRPATEVAGSPLLVEGTAFEFGPAGLRIESPLTLWLAYPNTVATGDRPRLRIHRFDGDGWREVPGGGVEMNEGRARADLDRLGTFAVLRRAPPVALSMAGGTGQEAPTGSAVPIAPSVVLRNASQQPVADIAVRFEVTGGGGSIEGGDTGLSDADGVATLPGAWRLGQAMGANSLRAVAVGFDLASVTFVATAIDPPPEIRLSVPEVNFDTFVDGDAPDPRFVNITNAGGQQLVGLSLGPIQYSTVPGWLSVSLSQAVAPATLTLSVASTGVPPGSHEAFVPVRSSAPGVKPETLHVQLGMHVATVSRLEITRQLDGAVSGHVATTQPMVELQASSGSIVRSADGFVTASLADGDGTLRGTTSVPAQDGVATFTDLRVDGGGGHRLRFSYEGIHRNGAEFDVEQLLAQLVIQRQPGGAEEDEQFDDQPVILLIDEAGLLVRESGREVTVSVAAGDGALRGSLTRTADQGVVRFNNLRIAGAIGFHRLRFATSNPDVSVLSVPFLVWPD